MKLLFIAFILMLTACGNEQIAEKNTTAIEKQEKKESSSLPVPEAGSKWKADENTNKNAAALAKLTNDPLYQDASKRKELASAVGKQVDTLVNQCSMQGAAHDALHGWLKTILKDIRELKEEDENYEVAYSALKKDVADYYRLFE